MPGAARQGDMCTEGPLLVGSPDTRIDGRPACRFADYGTCQHGAFHVFTGSQTVFINSVNAARRGDPVYCQIQSGVIVLASPDVNIGG